MRRKFISILLFLVCFIYFSIGMNMKYEKQTMEDCSEEIAGTILKSQIVEKKGNNLYLLYTKEHANAWHIKSFGKEKIEFWDFLEEGDDISFCIKEKYIGQVNSKMTIDMLSLQINGELVYSLDDYNKLERMNVIKDKVIVIGTSCLLGVMALYISFTDGKRRKERDEGQ